MDRVGQTVVWLLSLSPVLQPTRKVGWPGGRERPLARSPPALHFSARLSEKPTVT